MSRLIRRTIKEEVMPNTVTHPACGKTWPNLDRNSHCTVCHETFGSHRIADRHRREVEGQMVCVDPAMLTINGRVPVLRYGLWVSGPRPTAAEVLRSAA